MTGSVNNIKERSQVGADAMRIGMTCLRNLVHGV